jgi:hypothetical protein
MTKYIFLILIISYSCKTKSGYIFEQKRYYHFENSYDKNDSLYLSDYILFCIHSKSGLNNFGKVSLNEDSLFHKFKDSFNSLNLLRSIGGDYSNKVTEDFSKNHYLHFSYN